MSSVHISRCSPCCLRSSSDRLPSKVRPLNNQARRSRTKLPPKKQSWPALNGIRCYDEFEKWLGSQAIFTPADIDRINSNLLGQIRVASASELQGILDDWQAKLKVLNGRDFQDAQQWLGEYLSVFADGVRRRRLQTLGLTNVENMTAGQLEDAIVRIRAHRLAAQQRQSAFDQRRQEQVQAVQQSNAARQQARQQARSGAGQFGTNQSPYSPGLFDPPPLPRRQFFVGPDGRIAFMLPL